MTLDPRLPFGVKYSIVINRLQMGVAVIVIVLALGMILPDLIEEGRLSAAGEITWLDITGMIFLILAVGAVPIVLLYFINKGLSALKESARIFQMMVSAVFLIGFPIGTILHGISLYYMIFDEQTRNSFDPSRR
ncbi:MAG: hypothetical protein AB7S78_06620 [Candidatus Omnitrophota bacterium]